MDYITQLFEYHPQYAEAYKKNGIEGLEEFKEDPTAETLIEWLNFKAKE